MDEGGGRNYEHVKKNMYPPSGSHNIVGPDFPQEWSIGAPPYQTGNVSKGCDDFTASARTTYAARVFLLFWAKGRLRFNGSARSCTTCAQHSDT